MKEYEKVFTFKNSVINRFIIKRMRNALNSESYRIRLRARHNDRKKLLKERYRKNRQNDIRINDAQYFAVYIDDKRKEREQKDKQRRFISEQLRKAYEYDNN